MGEGKRDGCNCEKCQECCTREPGWFAPGEAKMVAKVMGISFDHLVDNYLEKHLHDDIAILSPKREDRRGTCVFFDNGMCKIHDVKPHECRKVYGCEEGRRHKRIREILIRMWQKNH